MRRCRYLFFCQNDIGAIVFMKKSLIFAILIGILLCVIARATLAGTFRDNFDDGDLIGWETNIATGISVVNGELRFKNPDLLIAKLGDSSWKEYSLEARVKITEFVNGGWFSVRILQGGTGDPSGYYELRLIQGWTVASLYVNDLCLESFRMPADLKENVWHSVKISPSNGRISFYLDDSPIAQLADVGLSGYADMCITKGIHVYVDDVAISGPNIPDTGPSGINSFAVGARSRYAITWGEIKRKRSFSSIFVP